MQYRTIPKINKQVSALGLGCMRFPTLADDTSQIDEQQTIDMIRYSINHGINYIDTAYVYHQGNSEPVIGKALADGYREQVFLTTKLPVVKMTTAEDFDSYLDEQLTKLNTDYLDFYLLHALNYNNWQKTLQFDLLTKLDKAIQEGKIRYPGFSIHAGTPLFKEIVDSYDWIMSLVQYNYLDEHNQVGWEGIKYAYQNNIAVSVMEPLRGGKLAQNPPEEVKAKVKSDSPEKQLARLGLAWVLNHKEVSVVLSGMSNLDEIQENIHTASNFQMNSLTKAQLELISDIKRVYQEKIKVNCTSCRYCIPCKEANVAIPFIFDLINDLHMFENDKVKHTYARLMEKERDASKCISCSKCEEVCPQSLHITKHLQDAHELLTD